MPAYLAFGLRIDSERALPSWIIRDTRALTPSGGQSDVTIRWAEECEPDAGAAAGDSQKGWYDFHPLRHRFGWPQVGVIEVRQGREVVVHPRPDVAEGMVEEVLLGAVMADILLTRGFIPLHASSNYVAGRAIAIVGRSGTGKSTLADALDRDGHPARADDLVAVPTEGPPLVPFSFSRIKLDRAPEAATKRGEFRRRTALRAEKGPGGGVSSLREPLPLAAIYWITDSDSLAVEPVDPRQALFEVYANCFRVEVEQYMLGADELLRRCASVASRVPFFKLHRPRELAKLPQVVDAIVAHVVSLQER